MEPVVKLLHRRRSRNQTGGAILLADGKTRCKNVVCTSGAVVKDVIDDICRQEKIQIVPIARPFFALCDPKSGMPLCPHHTLTQEEARKKYQLRVFINTGENSLQFLRMSRAAYNYYYKQLREEFIGDRLYPRASVNTGIWMAAIDMAREAHEKNSDYADIIRTQRDMLNYMPKFLKEKCAKEPPVAAKLEDTFRKFRQIRDSVGVDHYESKYVEVYEKDVMCGRHIFRLKNDDSKKHPTLAVVSGKDGIYQVHTGETGGDKKDLCSIFALTGVDVDSTTVVLEIRRDSSEPSEQETEERQTLHFYDRREAHSFAIIVHAYYQLLVNANEVILTGNLAPQEQFLRVGCNPNDGKRLELCHAPIPPHYVSSTLTKNGMMSDGNFLIRESRNTDDAYTLSLCFRGKVMNYRIVYDKEEGYSFQDPQTEDGESSGTLHQTFPTLMGLITHHQKTADGLPSVLKMNYSPEVTGPIPLLKQLGEVNRPIYPGPISFPPATVINTDDESSMASTPSPHTPFSNTKVFENGTAGRGASGSMDRGSPASSLASYLPGPLSPAESPPAVELPSKQPEVGHTSPFISELVNKGVRYIEYSSLKVCSELGSGHYSTVYLADWMSENRKVAMKIPTMKEHNVDDVKKDLMREILTMSKLDHPHVVQLLGISDTKHYLDYIGVIPVVIMEFVDKGCLRSFLNNFKRTVPPDSYNKRKTDFLLYGKQIAEGMHYLAQSKIVHRDLAARNVLLVSNDQIKISDFGLARQQLENSDYYKSKGSSNDLPIYWYAPECLSSFKFSTKGDVWSYGVTLWEMFTLGDNPNSHLGPIVRRAQSVQMAFKGLVDAFSSNFRLPSMACDQRVYSTIIMKCWELDPQQRPSFNTLSQKMGELYDMVVSRNKGAAPSANTSVAASNPSKQQSLSSPPVTTISRSDPPSLGSTLVSTAATQQPRMVSTSGGATPSPIIAPLQPPTLSAVPGPQSNSTPLLSISTSPSPLNFAPSPLSSAPSSASGPPSTASDPLVNSAPGPAPNSAPTTAAVPSLLTHFNTSNPLSVPPSTPPTFSPSPSFLPPSTLVN